MKILHVCYSDDIGGAAKAALRLVKAQRKMGIDAYLLVINKRTDYQFALSVSKIKEIKLKTKQNISRFILRFNKSTNPILHSLNLFASDIHKIINKFDCDIINLHWVNHEMLSIKEIAQIKKPIVWTLHDSWAFCGAEHHPASVDDFSFAKGYLPNPYKGINFNRLVFNKKMKYWKTLDVRIVCPSSWLAKIVNQSPIFFDATKNIIPNCLNENIFKPIDKNYVRNILNLNENNIYILFGADGNPYNKIKGGDLLIESLNIFKNKYPEYDEKIHILIFGSFDSDKFNDIKFPITFMGKLNDEYSLSLIYNSVDVVLVPSRMDNLPQVATEAACCGIPIVSYDIGGLIDIIEHKVTGYTAQHYNTEDFADGIYWVLNEKISSEIIRKRAISLFEEKRCSDSYFNLYQEIMTV
jgi:glycosyltransferase involved in cell wall biosynthesis